MKLSISMKQLLGTMVIILLPMVAIYCLTTANISRLSLVSFNQAATGELRQVNNMVVTFLGEARYNIDMVASLPVIKRLGELKTTFVDTTGETLAKVPPEDEAGVEMYEAFGTLRESHPDYIAVYVGNRDGKFIINHRDPNKKQSPGFDPRQRPWWKQTIARPREAVVTAAYEGVGNVPMLSACKAILDDKGEVLGVAAIDITLTQISDLINKIRFGRTGYVMLVQDDGVIISNPKDPAQNFKNISTIGNDALAGLFKNGSDTGVLTIGSVAYRAAVFTSPELKWKFIGLIEESELMEPVSKAVGEVAIVVILSLTVIGLAIWYFTGRMVITPLKTVKNFLGDIARGEYGHLSNTRADEMGTIFEALNTMSATLKANITEIEHRTAEAQEKAHACQLATEEAQVAKLQADRARAEGMLDAARRLEQVTADLNEAAGDLSGFSENIRQGTEVQRRRIDATATAMGEMNSTVLEVARNASNAAEQGKDARDKASQGAHVVASSLDAMRATQRKAMSLRESMGQLDVQAQSIGKIMTTIEDIADQTNLLALNAAIEAARAGEAGRGFAVVADEVRKLAEKTMVATKEVGDSIQSIQRVAGENVRSVEEAVNELDHAAKLASESGSALGEIVSSTDSSAGQIQSIATAAEEQSATSEEINRAIEEINSIAVQTDEHVEASLTALENLGALAQSLAGLIRELKEHSGDVKRLGA